MSELTELRYIVARDPSGKYVSLRGSYRTIIDRITAERPSGWLVDKVLKVYRGDEVNVRKAAERRVKELNDAIGVVSDELPETQSEIRRRREAVSRLREEFGDPSGSADSIDSFIRNEVEKKLRRAKARLQEQGPRAQPKMDKPPEETPCNSG